MYCCKQCFYLAGRLTEKMKRKNSQRKFLLHKSSTWEGDKSFSAAHPKLVTEYKNNCKKKKIKRKKSKRKFLLHKKTTWESADNFSALHLKLVREYNDNWKKNSEVVVKVKQEEDTEVSSSSAAPNNIHKQPISKDNV